MRHGVDKIYRNNQNTHFVFRNFFSFMWCRKIWSQEVTNDTIWRISVVCWISKATRASIHINIYPNTYCFSTSTIIRERASVYVIRALPVLLMLNLVVHKVTTRLYGVQDTLCQIHIAYHMGQWHLLWKFQFLRMAVHVAISSTELSASKVLCLVAVSNNAKRKKKAVIAQ
jgi:hypothetical protein